MLQLHLQLQKQISSAILSYFFYQDQVHYYNHKSKYNINFNNSAGTSGKSADELMKEKIKELLDQLPPLFDVEKAAIKHPVRYEESMNTVL